MNPNLAYLRYVLRHKFFVFKAGLKTKTPIWQLIVHDWTKFTPAEWTPYVNRFFAGNAGKEDKSADPFEFHEAWKHHWTHNSHHWEYWVRYDEWLMYNVPSRMPERYAREMVADWMGAGRAITGKWEIREWYDKTKSKQNIHPATRAFVEQLLDEVAPVC